MFKDILKQLRTEKGLTQEELAKILNVQPGAIGNYEQGQRLPKDDKMWIKIAKFFNVSVDYLMDFDNPYVQSNPPQYLSYGGSGNPKKEELINLINKTDITDEKIDLLIDMIESWQ